MTTKIKPSVTVETITPEVAEEMLKDNKGNRKPRPTVWKRYARDMVDGNWSIDSSMIIFDWNGRLIDGQHRLLAVIDSGVTIECVVRRGADPDTRLTIDVGFKRQLKDLLDWNGEVNTTSLAAGIRMDWRLAHDLIFIRGQQYASLSFHESLAWLDENPGLRAATTIASNIKGKLGIPTAGAVAFIHRIRLIDSLEATQFLDQLTSGQNMAKGQATYATRTWCLNKQYRAGTGQKPNSDLYAAILIKGWNAWVQGKPVEYLVFRQGGSRAEDFPHLLDMEGQPMPLVSEMELRTMPGRQPIETAEPVAEAS